MHPQAKQKGTHAMAQTLTEARIERGITQLRLAVEAGISPTSLSYIECKHKGTTKETFLKLCAVLGVDPDTITGVIVREKTGRPKRTSVPLGDVSVGTDAREVEA